MSYRTKYDFRVESIGYSGLDSVLAVSISRSRCRYILTSSTAKKTLNIRNNSKVYFFVDECNIPYKGVKGRGTATIFKDQATIISAAEKISTKYYGSLEYDLYIVPQR
ncbi:MAG TPA: hypothetical protein VE548_06600 [Nitrososphaeraceae archaeon]|nr:hypothetical protein [Nitrososphaeraceae archaeon]